MHRKSRWKSRFIVKNLIGFCRWGNTLANPQFRSTILRLLLSYLIAMMLVMTLSSVVLYNFFFYSLTQQLDSQLLTLADAAAHNLSAIQADRTAIHRKIQIIDDDGDLDIPWQDLRLYHQSVEWFDADKKLLAKAGEQFPQVPFVSSFHSWQQNGIRTLTIPVYASETNQQLLGYVRVSTSMVGIQKELNRLLMSLGITGVLEIALIAGTGWWLTSKALQPIERSFLQLQQFTADASHELRSPLTAMKTTVEVMQSHPERIHSDDIKKIALIESAIQQMTHLVEDLLLLARSDVASVSLSKTAIPIPVDEILFDLIDRLQPQAESQGITLEADLRDEVWVKGDAHQLQRLFGNLLENALQYTPHGGFIRVKMFKTDSFMVTEVTDTGIGIAPEHLPLVFNRFWRAEKARSRRQGGSGLGLAIAQAITYAHGGEISVTSKLGVGSCFRVKLPVFHNI